ncbi:hypothetical protein N9J50_01210 [Methylophilaceae bacterium]|nr:hypothetical protein [Methylophilaceae bacterium]
MFFLLSLENHKEVEGNGFQADYSEAAGDVKYLIGIAKFNESKTVNTASTGMQAQLNSRLLRTPGYPYW